MLRCRVTAGEVTDMAERSAARGGVDIDLLQGDIAKVQEWLGDANIATTRIYDHRKTRPEDSILENRRERLSFLKLGEKVQIFHAPKIVNAPLSTT
jgi:integrase